MQLEPSFVALLEDNTLDPATDLSNLAVREQHADDRPYAASAYSPNDVFTDSWQQTSDDVHDCEDSTMAQGSWGDVELEDDCEDSTMAQGSWGSAELENDDFAVGNGGLVDGDFDVRDGGLVDGDFDVGDGGLVDGDFDVGDGGLVDGDSDVGDGGLVAGDAGGVGDGDVWDAVDGDVWDGFDLGDVEIEEVADHKLMEDDNAVDNASRPGAGIGAGVGAAASVGGATRLPEDLAVKWQAADTQVRILLTHCSLHCTTLESFRLRLAYIYRYMYI